MQRNKEGRCVPSSQPSRFEEPMVFHPDALIRSPVRRLDHASSLFCLFDDSVAQLKAPTKDGIVRPVDQSSFAGTHDSRESKSAKKHKHRHNKISFPSVRIDFYFFV
jgi:hypothetical protein